MIAFAGNIIGGAAPYEWSWDFGDGNSADEQNPSHSYSEIGEYTVILTVTDDGGLEGIDSTTATITFNPDLSCDGSLSWNVKKTSRSSLGPTVTGTFTVTNVGPEGSLLDWKVDTYPMDMGTWTFTPSSGDDLDAGGTVTIDVSVVTTDTEGTYSGSVVLVNKDDSSDSCEIPVSLTVPKIRTVNLLWILFERLFDRFPFLLEILNLQ